MPPASLSTFAVTKPGPTTARKRTRRLRHRLSENGIAHLAVPQHRDHVVGGDDADESSVGIDDGKREEVVFVEGRRDLVFWRIECAGNDLVTERPEPRRGHRDGDLQE